MAYHPQFQPLSFEQNNPFLIGLLKGQEFGQNLQQFPLEQEKRRLANIQEAVKAQYAQPMAEQALLGAQQENLWNPKRWQSEINVHGAQANLYGEQAKHMREMTPFEKSFKEAQVAEQRSLASLHDTQARHEQLKMNLYENALNGDPNAMQQVESSYQTQVRPSAESLIGNYGVEIPRPTREDIINKNLYGFDTYSDKYKLALDQRKKQEESYNKKIIEANQSAASANNLDRLLSQYDYWMDQGIATGPVGGRLPAMGTPSQSVNNIINQISLGGIEQVRDAMGSARFAVADLNVALGLKPQRTWAKGTRTFYKDFANAVDGRLKERAQFLNIAGGMKIPEQYAEALWTEYQNRYPIADTTGTSVVKRKGDEWRQFLTPEALESITSKGNYNPVKQSDINEQNIKDTMHAIKKSKEEVLNLLEAQGYDVSQYRRKK